MAKSRTSSRSPASWMFIVSGVLLGIELLFAVIDPAMTSTWLTLLAWVALAITYLLLFLQRARDGLLNAAFIIAAIGWALLALQAVVPGLGTLGSFASVVALVGTLGSGILVFLRTYFGRETSIVYLVTTIVAALLLLDGVRGFLPGQAVTAISVVFAAGLVVTGVLLQRRR